MNIDVILQFSTVISGILMMVLILLQQRGATLGAGFGASGELYTERRGVEKSIFRATVFFAFVFVASILITLLLPK
ncbi:preprotein translocase subunit SecG [Candidatus Saccharibacteria bacterium]|nr:preprotein translocase subunit SecG [Candidatus Saccharibacteria bacterium]